MKIQFNKIDDVENWEKGIIIEFISKYNNYIDEFSELGISLEIQPVYYYRKIKKLKSEVVCYHTQRKDTGCFLAFRIILHPKSITYKQAIKEFYFQNFYSKKIVTYKRIGEIYQASTHSLYDWQVNLFLKKYLNKAKAYKRKSKDTKLAIKEKISDVFRSIVAITRYREESKMTYHGKSLDGYYILSVFILMIIGVYLHIRLKYPELF